MNILIETTLYLQINFGQFDLLILSCLPFIVHGISLHSPQYAMVYNRILNFLHISDMIFFRFI